ncbi:hypothetical protein [Candidatus Avelusimicrobium luingense]|uniref:hypothetical protein n=1 Tax=Candidatus Avelusimicrobium luingense TaxID=3416211 RepID=UPI003D0C97F9
MKLKKVFLLALLLTGNSLGWAQNTILAAPKQIGKTVTGEVVDVHALIAQQMSAMCRQMMISTEIRVSEKYNIRFADMRSDIPSILALDSKLENAQDYVLARIVPKNDDIVYKQASWNLRFYLMNLMKEEGTHFFYRGMRLASLEAIDHVLLHGLEVNKTAYNGIYMTPMLAVAEGYSGSTQGEIQVIVVLDSEAVIDHLKQDMPGEAYSERNIPPFAIVEVLAFLEINGKPEWYRVVLDDEGRVFIPLPASKRKIDDFEIDE